MRSTHRLLALFMALFFCVAGVAACACNSDTLGLEEKETKKKKKKKKKKSSKKKKKKSSKKKKKSDSEEASAKKKKSSKKKKKSTAKKKELKDPPKVQWADYKMTLDGSEANATFFLRGYNQDGKDPMFVNAYFSNFPEGTEVKAGKDEGTASTSGYISMAIDVRINTGLILIDDLQNKGLVDFDYTITITMPDHKPFDVKLPLLRAKSAVGSYLAQVRDKPIEFNGEPKDEGGKPATALVEAAGFSSKFKVLGAAKRVWDIDLVGIQEKEESDRTKLCKGYKKAPEGVTIKMVDAKVSLYDRRSGEMLTEGVVKAKNSCPMFVMIDKKTNSAKHYASDRAVEQWFRKALRTHGKRR